MKTLAEIYEKYQTAEGYGDKGTAHTYIDLYAKLFADIRLSAKNVLEVGTGQGHSMLMWKEYFDSAKIFGVEIDPDLCRVSGERIRVDVFDITLSTEIAARYSNTAFDVIIDDGSHYLKDQLLTYHHLYPYLEDGGLYIIEDIIDIDASWDQFLGLHDNVEILDNRRLKNRSDDVMVVIRDIDRVDKRYVTQFEC